MVKDIGEAKKYLSSDGCFPRLRSDKKFEVTSKRNVNFNCIAWAMRLCDRWVDTQDTAGHWWPVQLDAISPTQDGLITAFESLKFVKCDNSEPEFFYDKVALYYHPITKGWTHAARIISVTEYHSKLGGLWDIHHSNGSVLHNPKYLNVTYGSVYQIMKRHKIYRFYSLWLIIVRLFQNIKEDIYGLL